MKWSEEKVNQLKGLAAAGASNKDIAHQLGVGINDVYAKRSQLGITIDKIKAGQSEMVISPEVEKAVQDMDNRADIRARRDLIRLLEPAIIMADKSVSHLEVVDGGKTVLVVQKSGVGTRVDIDGDSLLAIIADVTRKCLF